jgi:hypothetical protein
MEINQTIRLLSIGLLVTLSATASIAQSTTPAATNNANQAAGVTTAAPSPTPAPVAEMPPPKTPKVTCSGGNLSISADNSTLGAILTAVRACTGVQIDIPESAAGRRTFEELGPGPERQVLESLLSGTDLNFVIESSDDNPQKIASVLLMAQTKDTKAPPASDTSLAGLSPNRRAWMHTVQVNKQHASSLEDESQADPSEVADVTAKDDSAATPVSSPAVSATPAPVSDTASSSPPPEAPVAPVESAPASTLTSSNSPVNPALNSDKSTSERISDMQQMFEQRRTLNQSQSTTTPQ